jgi:hypothetical protein
MGRDEQSPVLLSLVKPNKNEMAFSTGCDDG